MVATIISELQRLMDYSFIFKFIEYLIVNFVHFFTLKFPYFSLLNVTIFWFLWSFMTVNVLSLSYGIMTFKGIFLGLGNSDLHHVLTFYTPNNLLLSQENNQQIRLPKKIMGSWSTNSLSRRWVNSICWNTTLGGFWNSNIQKCLKKTLLVG